MSDQPSSSHDECSCISASQSQTRPAKHTPAQYFTATQRKPFIQESSPDASKSLIKYRILHDKKNNTVSYTNIMDDEELATFHRANQRPRGRSPSMHATSTDDESESDSDIESKSAILAEDEPENIPDEFYQGNTVYIEGKKYWGTHGSQTIDDLLAEKMLRINCNLWSDDSAAVGSASSASTDSLDTVDRELRKRNQGQDKGKGVERDDKVLPDRTRIPERPQQTNSHRTQNSKNHEPKPQRHHEMQTFMAGTDPRKKDPSISISDISVFRSPNGSVYIWTTHICSFDQGPTFEADEHCYTCGRLNYPLWKKTFDEKMQSFKQKLMESNVNKQPSDMLIARRMQADEIAADMGWRTYGIAAQEPQDFKTKEEKQSSDTRRKDRGVLDELTDKERIDIQRTIAAGKLEMAGDLEMVKILETRYDNLAKLSRKYPGIREGPLTEEKKKMRDAFSQEMSKLNAEYNKQLKELVGW